LTTIHKQTEKKKKEEEEEEAATARPVSPIFSIQKRKQQ